MRDSLRSLFSGTGDERIARLLWGAALFALPVTSFRHFPLLGDSTYVRPLSLYPVAFLLPLLLLQLSYGRRSFSWPGTLTPLLAFMLVAIVSTSLGLLLDPLPLRGFGYPGRVARAWLTLFIGLSFFIAAIWMNRRDEDVQFSIRWLLAGLVMNILWSGVQALAFYTPLLEKVTVTHWQLAFSMRELVKTNRVSGMAYEPAWLAGQIATVYLPWLAASLLTGRHVTRFRGLEGILLAGAALLLLGTFSRGGLFIAAAAAVLTLLFAGRQELRAGIAWLAAGFQPGGNWMLRAGLLILMVSALAGSAWFLGQKGYIARLFNTRADTLEEFIIGNSAGARAAYTVGALGAYDESPLLGVGLGASGFYIYDHLPDWSLTTVPEIARQLSPRSRLYPNPKNMYVRLLAETGLVGLFVFTAFLFSMLGDGLRSLQQGTALGRYLGIAGIFTWFAIALYNGTQDSFATPNLWINFGILVGVTASSEISGGENTTLPEGSEPS